MEKSIIEKYLFKLALIVKGIMEYNDNLMMMKYFDILRNAMNNYPQITINFKNNMNNILSEYNGSNINNKYFYHKFFDLSIDNFDKDEYNFVAFMI